MTVSRVCWFLLTLLSGVSVAVSLPAPLEAAGQFAAASGHALEAVAGPVEPEDPGVIVYRANYCGVCHELPAAGTRGTFGPSHAGMGETAAERVAAAGYGGDATTAREYITESILAPSAYLVPGYATSTHPMPSFAHLSEADVSALVTLLLAQ